MEKLQFQNVPIDKEKLVEELVDDDQLRTFFIENDLDTKFIEKHLSSLLIFKTENDKCIGCTGIDECKQDLIGRQPLIQFEKDAIEYYYKDCHFNIVRTRQINQTQFIDAMYMPKMIYEASLEDFDFTKGKNRTYILNKMKTFISQYLKGEKVKGLYLYGQYQRGKTYSIAALANELSQRGIGVIIAYYPDLVREFKSSIGNGNLEVLVSKLKAVEVLMLDDIGGESPSAWVRDEVLGPILQHRLLDEKPTFFTSNVAQKELINYMILNTQKAEAMKGARIDARIRSLSEEIEM